MIIDQCKRAAPPPVFPDALDVRVLKAAHYRSSRARIRSSSPALRCGSSPWRTSAATGVQVIDPHSNAMREAFATPGRRAGDARTRSTSWPTADVRRGDGQRRAGRGVYRRKSRQPPALRAGLALSACSRDVKRSSLFLMLPQYAGQLFADCSVVPQPTAAQLADIAIASAETASDRWRSAAGGNASFSTHGSARHPCVANVQQATEIVRQRAAADGRWRAAV